MAIPKAAIIGHGLGAWVTAEFARLYPDKAPRIMLISAPLFNMHDLDRRAHPARSNSAQHHAPAVNEATIMNSTIRTAMLERIRAAQVSGDITADIPGLPALPIDTAPRYNPLQPIIGSNTPEMLLQRCLKRSDPLYAKLEVDLPKTDLQALRVSALEFDCGRFLDAVWLLNMPTVVLHGMEDALIEAPDESVWNYVTANKEDRLLPIPLPGVHHFSMLEYDRFNRLVNEFLEVDDISRLEVKERWKRRSR